MGELANWRDRAHKAVRRMKFMQREHDEALLRMKVERDQARQLCRRLVLETESIDSAEAERILRTVGEWV